MLLKVDGIHTYYGFSYILQGISLEVTKGEAVALLGRNGAGKTTTLRSIIGVTPPRSGKIFFEGANIAGLPSYKIVRRGIAIIPDTRRIIPNITVRDNLVLAMLKNKEKGEEKSLLEMAFGYFPRLRERANNLGAALSGGEQQMLAIARGLVAKPKLMLVDEPTEGLMPTLVEVIADRLIKLQQSGLTMLLVETNLDVALKVASRVYVMEKGQIKFSGSKEELIGNTEIQQSYLGVSF
ncbi:MAG: ABC-type branched-chain amino acid transport system, ATPase component [Deltaproteobacteria bacterium]|nr:ABC-type branched-chain amino acid transport system, ATPase component [Deltaproteobacteria bacterium]